MPVTVSRWHVKVLTVVIYSKSQLRIKFDFQVQSRVLQALNNVSEIVSWYEQALK